MKRRIGSILAILPILLLGSCPGGGGGVGMYNWYQHLGLRIENYPEWINVISNSEWRDWQTESGKLVFYLPSNFGHKVHYNGKFRLYIDPFQHIAIEFDDSVRITFLHIWLGKAPESLGKEDTTINIIQTDPDIFTFNGFAEYEYYGSRRKTTARYEKTHEQNDYYELKYTLMIEGEEVITLPMKTVKRSALTKNTHPLWLPDGVYKDNTPTRYYNLVNYGDPDNEDIVTFTHFFPLPFSLRKETFSPLDKSLFTIEENALMYWEGMEQVRIDDEKQTVLYRMKGGPPGAPEYLEIHRLGGGDEIVGEEMRFRWLDSNEDLVREQILEAT